MSDILKNWQFSTDLHKWINSLIKTSAKNDREKGYNDALLDVKIQIEKLIKENSPPAPVTKPIKLTST